MYDPLTGARLVTREMSESMTFRMNRPAARKLRQAAAASGKSLSAFARDPHTLRGCALRRGNGRERAKPAGLRYSAFNDYRDGFGIPEPGAAASEGAPCGVH